MAWMQSWSIRQTKALDSRSITVTKWILSMLCRSAVTRYQTLLLQPKIKLTPLSMAVSPAQKCILRKEDRIMM